MQKLPNKKNHSGNHASLEISSCQTLEEGNYMYAIWKKGAKEMVMVKYLSYAQCPKHFQMHNNSNHSLSTMCCTLYTHYLI